MGGELVSAVFATTTPVPQIKATCMPLKQSVELNLMRAGLGQTVSQHHAVRTKAVPMMSYAVSRM